MKEEPSGFAAGAGPLRPPVRARRLRRRLRRRSQGPQVARHRRRSASRSCSTSSTAAPAAARRTPATAPASSCRCRTRFLRQACAELGIKLPAAGRVRRRRWSSCRPTRPTARACEQLFEQIVREEGQTVLGWRDGADRQPHARPDGAGASQPVIRQVFIGRGRRPLGRRRRAFERKLYVIRKRVETRGARARTSRRRRMLLHPQPVVQDASSTRGCSTPTSCAPFYPDLRDPAMESALALVHSRFSTNTFPSWARAHPVPLHLPTTARSTRCAATSTGCTPARACSRPTLFGDDLKKILPIIDTDGSDSAMFDNVPRAAGAGRAARCRTR